MTIQVSINNCLTGIDLSDLLKHYHICLGCNEYGEVNYISKNLDKCEHCAKTDNLKGK